MKLNRNVFAIGQHCRFLYLKADLIFKSHLKELPFIETCVYFGSLNTYILEVLSDL